MTRDILQFLVVSMFQMHQSEELPPPPLFLVPQITHPD